MTEEKRTYHLRGKPGIASLKKAQEDAVRLVGHSDQDIAHMGEVVRRISKGMLEARQRQLEELREKEKKKVFYTSAHASARDD